MSFCSSLSGLCCSQRILRRVKGTCWRTALCSYKGNPHSPTLPTVSFGSPVLRFVPGTVPLTASWGEVLGVGNGGERVGVRGRKRVHVVKGRTLDWCKGRTACFSAYFIFGQQTEDAVCFDVEEVPEKKHGVRKTSRIRKTKVQKSKKLREIGIPQEAGQHSLRSSREPRSVCITTTQPGRRSGGGGKLKWHLCSAGWICTRQNPRVSNSHRSQFSPFPLTHTDWVARKPECLEIHWSSSVQPVFRGEQKMLR